MKRPSFQFYPADWRNNANLRRCSHAARGVWMDILSVLHDADEYGVIRWPLAELANAASVPMRLVKELVEKKVLKGSDGELAEPYIYIPRSGRKDGPAVTLIPIQKGPIWFSSRFVRDEYKRQNSGKDTRFGAQENDETESLNHSPSHRLGANQGDGSTSSSSTSLKKEKECAGAQGISSELPEVESPPEQPPESEPTFQPPPRVAHAPPIEQVQLYFAMRDAPEMVDSFLIFNDARGWTFPNGEKIVHWAAWAGGWIKKARDKLDKEKKAAEKKAAAAAAKHKPSIKTADELLEERRAKANGLISAKH